MQNNFQKIITKASGKVLIAGGYGVLEQFNYGLTLALQNYFYCICLEYQSNLPTNICIKSPQIQQQWSYAWNKQQQKLAQKNDKINIFVANAIRWTLLYFNKSKQAGNIILKIIFDRGYISDDDALDPESCYPKYKEGYRKTGLGSSACVIVSIVKCLVELFLSQQSQNLSKQQKLKIINIISQTANLSAQNKIGSNFDISTAIYGTHLYKNILPYSIFSIINQANPQQQMKKLVNIDNQIKIIRSLPISLYGYIIDVKKGANTRVMVSGFISKLKQCQPALQKQFFEGSRQITLELYEALVKNQMQKCKIINGRHRILQRKYSKITGVPVQPEDLTDLIDRVQGIQGVCYAICPGSGGYDAIFVLATKQVFSEIQKQIGHENIVKIVALLLDDVDQAPSLQKKQQLISLYS